MDTTEDLTLEFFDLGDLAKEQVREIIPPFDTDESLDAIEDYFRNEQEGKPKLYFKIDYGKSKLKGTGLLTSIINLGITAEIVFKEITYEEKAEIIKSYISLNCYGCIPSLTRTICSLVFCYKEFESYNFNSIFTAEEEKQFIKDNKELVGSWTIFLDSMLLFLYKTSPIRDSFKDSDYEEIKDNNYIGKNVLTIFNIKDFFYYYEKPAGENTNLINFTYYFSNKNHYLAGQNLYSRFINKYNIQAQLIYYLAKSGDGIEKLVKFIQSVNNLK